MSSKILIILACVPLYVVNSGIDKKQISPVDSMKLLAVQAMIAKKDGRSSDDINILSILKGYFDPTAKENLDSIKAGIEKFFTEPKKEAEIKAEPKKEPVENTASKKSPAKKKGLLLVLILFLII